MRTTDLENWVLSIIERVQQGQPVEDARVELKASWITDASKAARRIAGHANASGGETILWIIGIDEGARSVTGADLAELATWWPQVVSQFEGLAPALTASLNIPIDSQSVVALLFETERIPFVVKNPLYGQSSGGPIELEVPWREGTRVRTAKRADLIRLLVPLQKLPELELRSCTLSTYSFGQKEKNQMWQLEMKLYVIPHSERVVIPYHYSSISFVIPGVVQETYLTNIRITDGSSSGISRFSSIIEGRAPTSRHLTEILIDQPLQIEVEGSTQLPLLEAKEVAENAYIKAKLKPVGANRWLQIDAELSRSHLQTHRVTDPHSIDWVLVDGSVGQLEFD